MSAQASASVRPDRAAAVRAALRRLVAAQGFHGASMSAVAKEAGVATGTAYVHYASKEELILAAYVETKRRLGAAAVADVDPADGPQQRFAGLWLAAYRHLVENPDDARFLAQVDSSPYALSAHSRSREHDDDPLTLAAQEPDIAALLLPLSSEVLYELGMAPAVRLAAQGAQLTGAQLELVAGACWRAISVAG